VTSFPETCHPPFLSPISIDNLFRPVTLIKVNLKKLRPLEKRNLSLCGVNAKGTDMRPETLSPLTSANGQAPDAAPACGLTVREVARRYRVGEDKIRSWIGRGELAAVNVASALCGRPRWVVLPESLAEFEKRRAGGPPPKKPQRRRKGTERDWYP
jgi:hypothetical protein